MVHWRGPDFLHAASDPEISLKIWGEWIHCVNFVSSSKTLRVDFHTSVAFTSGQLVGRNVAEVVPDFIRITCFSFTRNFVPERCWFIHSSLIWKYFWATAKCQVLYQIKQIQHCSRQAWYLTLWSLKSRNEAITLKQWYKLVFTNSSIICHQLKVLGVVCVYHWRT